MQVPLKTQVNNTAAEIGNKNPGTYFLNIFIYIYFYKYYKYFIELVCSDEQKNHCCRKLTAALIHAVLRNLEANAFIKNTNAISSVPFLHFI